MLSVRVKRAHEWSTGKEPNCLVKELRPEEVPVVGFKLVVLTTSITACFVRTWVYRVSPEAELSLASCSLKVLRQQSLPVEPLESHIAVDLFKEKEYG